MFGISQVQAEAGRVHIDDDWIAQPAPVLGVGTRPRSGYAVLRFNFLVALRVKVRLASLETTSYIGSRTKSGMTRSVLRW